MHALYLLYFINKCYLPKMTSPMMAMWRSQPSLSGGAKWKNLPDFCLSFPVFPLFHEFPDFSPLFPDFPPIFVPLFPDFGNLFCCQGGHSSPCPCTGYTTGWLPPKMTFTELPTLLILQDTLRWKLTNLGTQIWQPPWLGKIVCLIFYMSFGKSSWLVKRISLISPDFRMQMLAAPAVIVSLVAILVGQHATI